MALATSSDVSLTSDAIIVAAPAIERTSASLMVASWQNIAQTLDVSGDRTVTALDALLLVSELNIRRVSTATGQLPPRAPASDVDQFFDTNGDGTVTPLDALLIIDYLNHR